VWIIRTHAVLQQMFVKQLRLGGMPLVSHHATLEKYKYTKTSALAFARC
jgi:hypothetical protein